MKAEDVIKAEDLIRRIYLIRSFLSKDEIKYVTKTYRTHSFRRTEKIPSLFDTINDVVFSPGFVFIENPHGTNFALGICDMEIILKNYCVVFRDQLGNRMN